MKQYKKILMTLVLLLTAASGVWAQTEELLTTITATGKTTYSATTEGVVDVELAGVDAFTKNAWEWNYDNGYIKVTPKDGYNVTKCVFKFGAQSITVYNSPFVIYYSSSAQYFVGTNIYDISTIEVYGTVAPDIEVTPVAGQENQWEFDMPASDVVLTPMYAPAAQWAKVETVEQLPAAAEGVIAGTDAPLIAEGTGIVAFAGTSTEVRQGQVMYAVTTATATEAPALSAFSADVPNAKDIADEGADVLVWYYIQGADTPDGQQATADNTFNNSDVCATPLTVTVLSNKFDLTLKPANANTIDATQASKGTVTVGGTDKTGDITDEGKLTAIKMGSEVKLSTKQGYKFRKVEVKKTGSAVLAPALENGATVVIICNWGYATTTFTYTNNGGTFSGQASGYEAEYFNNGLELNGKNLSFSASNMDNSEYLSVGITFNTESSAYSYTGKGQDFVSFTISVNGTDVTSQLTEAK